VLRRVGAEPRVVEILGRDGDEVWQRLAARFPESLPTHSREQIFYFDSAWHERRHDYTPDVFASWADAAQLMGNQRMFGGVSFPTLRRVFPRGDDNRAGTRPTLVWIEVSQIELVPAQP